MVKKFEELSERQQNILRFMDRYIHTNSFPPTIREIGNATDIESTSVVNYNLNKLVEAGYLERSDSKARGLRLIEDVPGGRLSKNGAIQQMPLVPLLGQIVAGEPISVPDDVYPDDEDMVMIPADWIQGISLTEVFALKVKGNSMIDAMIQDGDTVIFRKAKTAANGEMVAVWLDERSETTLKYFYNEGTRIRLQPAHPTMDPIYVDPLHCHIQGKVLSVLRHLS
jgi:repressor LexA